MGRGILLWLLGIPIPIIILLTGGRAPVTAMLAGVPPSPVIAALDAFHAQAMACGLVLFEPMFRLPEPMVAEVAPPVRMLKFGCMNVEAFR